MARRSVRENNVKVLPNAKKKLIIMLVSVVIMVFSVLQAYYLARYTLGLQVSRTEMTLYNSVLKLMSSEESNE